MMRVTVFDYGAGNLHSLVKTLTGADRTVRVDTDPRAAVLDTDVLVLPGVGAFAPAAERLAAGRDAMRQAILGGLPTLGICLGMQLMFDGSDEGAGLGLGVIPGRVTKLQAERLPQIGWNPLEEPTDPLFSESRLEIAYYANSFACRPVDQRVVTAWSTHDGDRFPAAVRMGACVGVQFHPEKSSAPGVRFVEAFLASARATPSSASTVGPR
jgi:imidazole glycerol-phosphate synthase subunit HisH